MEINQVKKNFMNLEKSTTYKCDMCKDLNFIIKDNTATPCKCYHLKKAKDILLKSNISEEFLKKTFKNFDYSIDMEIFNNYKVAYNFSKEFLEIEKTNKNSIMFLGQVGIGKTHLSMAIANELMNDGVAVIYMNYREDILKLKQNVLDEIKYNDLINRFKKARVLLIDDLFKGSITKSDINIMFEIVNFRYLNNLGIILSSQMNVNELLKVDEAIASRLIEMSKNNILIIENKSLNYRINMN